MSAFAAGMLEDLRRRRLLPVALLLLVTLIALPIVALKSAPEPTSDLAAPTAAPDATGGLPTPEQALQGEKPLVTLAVLDESSDLDQFNSKNPFKPIDQVSSGGAQDAVAPPGATGSPTGGAATAISGGSFGGTPTGGGAPPANPSPQSPRPDRAPERKPDTERRLTYAVDMTIRGPKGLRGYEGVPKLSLLPSADNPLLVFLGIEDAGTKAVFLVDAKLRSAPGEQEGTCTPAPDQCATLAMGPGEEHVLVNDQGQTWTLRVVEVRETSVAKAAAAARKAQKRRARQSRRAASDQPPVPRFLPPLITDLFTGGRS